MSKRLVKVAKEINVGYETIAEHLNRNGFKIEVKPTAKVTDEMYDLLLKDFRADVALKARADQINLHSKRENVEPQEKTLVKDKEEEKTLFIKNEEGSATLPPSDDETPAVPEKKEEIAEKEEVPAPEAPAPIIVKETPPTPPQPDVESEPEVEKPPVEEIPPPPKEQKETPPPPPPVEEEKVVETIEAKKEKVVPAEEVVPPSGKDDEPAKKEQAPEKEKKQPAAKTEKTTKTKPPKTEQKPKKEEKKKAVKRKKTEIQLDKPTVVGKIDLSKPIKPEVEQKTPETESNEPTVEKRVIPQLQGPKVVGKIDLKAQEQKEKAGKKRRRKRKRIIKKNEGTPKKQQSNRQNHPNRKKSNATNKRGKRKSKNDAPEVSEKEIQDKIRDTIARMSGSSKGKSQRAKIRRQRRDENTEKRQEEVTDDKKIIQVTEFVAANELAKLMDVAITDLITACFNMGMVVSINQRLDAELIEVVADEFGYEVEFIGVTEQEDEEDLFDDAEEDLKSRAPIVTIMGHVDHGKTSLLDYIRNTKVIDGEVGGITQHIGAYEVTTDSGKEITFLDTPGHEAFTAMRARGAKVTDIAVIVIAADDNVMPQTREAISHAQAAEVPMIFAINKIDRPESNVDKIKEQLANMNILVEDWGGKHQCQEISAKFGTNVDDLLEKILLEAEMLELKANPDRGGVGTIVEASLDKGRGYVATALVQNGHLKVGDMMLAGQYYGKIKAMFNERGARSKYAGPSTPVLLLGLNGAPQAGERLRITESESEARDVSVKRAQIMREQQQRASKHITLEEIGRRLRLGTFKELNLIIKGDVDGSVEALADSLLKLSTEEIQIRVIHRAVGPITESDVLLATASDAIIIGFQVRPTPGARRQAEQENIDIRLYSIIYAAIDEIKSAMEGMLEPTVEERFVCNVTVRETFKIPKVGTVAGCYVSEGKINRNTKIRLVRDGIVIYTGELDSLKRFKDDVKEVGTGMECGASIKNYNDIKVGDIIEGYEEVEVKRTL